MSAPPRTPPRVLIALRHARLRDAIAAELSSSTQLSVVCEIGDLEGAIREARLGDVDGIVIGTGLLNGDPTASLRTLAGALPGMRIVVVGTESSDAYARAMVAAGAVAYVSLQGGAEVLSASLELALQRDAP